MEINEEMCLKNIIKSKFDEYSEKNELIFTTFDFETEFFENQLLPYLFDADNYKGKTNNRGKYIAHELDPKLKKIDLKVFYDHFERDRVANINYKAFINPFQNILHAKLVIIIGQKNNHKSMTVLVTSANLTASSYGANMENIGVIESSSQDIINCIEKKDSLKDILEALNKIDEISITGIKEDKNKIIKELDKCNDLTVVSPFIDHNIINEFNNKIDKLNIIFTNLRGLKNKERFKEYSNIINVYPKNERKIHSKLYLLNNLKMVIIGSHNFTKNALKDGNIEASLIIKDEKIFYLCKNIEKKIKEKCKKFDIFESEIEVISEEEKEKNHYYYISKSEIDWKEEKMLFEIKSKNNEIKINSIKIVIGNEEINIERKTNVDKEIYSFDCDITEKIKDLIYESKYFDLIINQNILLSGILYEKNGVLDKLNTLKVQCFNEVLNYRFQNEVVNTIEYTEERKTNSQFKNIDENIISDNYSVTDMLLSIKNRRIDLANLKNKEEKYIIKFNSVKRLAYLFDNYYELDKKEDLEFRNNKRKVLYYFLTCNEIILLWNEFDFEKENVDKKEIRKKIENDFEELKKDAIAFITKEIKSISNTEAEEILEIYLKNFGEKNEKL